MSSPFIDQLAVFMVDTTLNGNDSLGGLCLIRCTHVLRPVSDSGLSKGVRRFDEYSLPCSDKASLECNPMTPAKTSSGHAIGHAHWPQAGVHCTKS
jgi:hypothetical protein